MKLSFLLFGLVLMTSCKQAPVEIVCYPPYRKLDVRAERISTVPEKLEFSDVMDTITSSKKYLIAD